LGWDDPDERRVAGELASGQFVVWVAWKGSPQSSNGPLLLLLLPPPRHLHPTLQERLERFLVPQFAPKPFFGRRDAAPPPPIKPVGARWTRQQQTIRAPSHPNLAMVHSSSSSSLLRVTSIQLFKNASSASSSLTLSAPLAKTLLRQARLRSPASNKARRRALDSAAANDLDAIDREEDEGTLELVVVVRKVVVRATSSSSSLQCSSWIGSLKLSSGTASNKLKLTDWREEDEEVALTIPPLAGVPLPDPRDFGSAASSSSSSRIRFARKLRTTLGSGTGFLGIALRDVVLAPNSDPERVSGRWLFSLQVYHSPTLETSTPPPPPPPPRR
jgi:hypothetical protein